ncbi:MAG TPA: hypothetical protein VGQ16_16700 [Vicinamibacterales bacterium]|jgi:hypothetical protein|nr:hypothetical protein [Vicinamibacterales bacterium]
MKLLLRYRDNLPASAGPAEKMQLRFFLSRQLRRVWENYFEAKHPLGQLPRAKPTKLPAANSLPYFMTVFDDEPSYRFVPLVTHGNKIRCRLSIRYGRWRTGGAAQLLDNGDIDARLKVLFDGLSIPQANQLNFSKVHLEHQTDTCFVLAEDDRLIESVEIGTFEILDAPKGQKEDNLETVFHIQASLKPFVDVVT